MNNKTVKELNTILVALFNSVMKLEEQALSNSSSHNLSITEIHTLDGISKGPVTMSQAASVMGVSVSTMTTTMSKLVNKGYASRFRVEEDRRIVKVEITEQGRQVVEEHEDFHMKLVSNAISGLSDEELEALTQSLGNIHTFFRKSKLKPAFAIETVELSPLEIGEYTVPVPIFQGGMGIGVSLSGLAGAVAAQGGVGIISIAQPGFAEPDFHTNPLKANSRVLQAELKKALAIAEKTPADKRGLVGVNLMCVSRHYEEYARAAVEGGAQVIVSGAGLPLALPGIVRESRVKLVPIVSSARAANLIVKNWTKKFNRVPDAMIFEGPSAGGHLGFKEEELDGAKKKFHDTIGEIKELIGACPLIAAGGIRTRKDIQEAISWGADGVQIGTRFVVTEECDVHPNFKKAYLECTEDDIVIIKSPVGMPGRAIKNDFIEKTKEGRIPPEKCNGCIVSCKPDTAMYCITKALIDAAKGDAENGLVFCGERAWEETKMTTVKEIFDELTSKG